jgi:hypothetical protein
MSPEHKKLSSTVETVRSRLDDSIELASFYKSQFRVGRTDVTKAYQILQFAVIGYRKKDKVGAHLHNPLARRTTGTSECWIVMQGKIEVGLFDTDDMPVYVTSLSKGDVAIFYLGGHSLKVLSRTAQIYELKNGPYEGDILDKKQI